MADAKETLAKQAEERQKANAEANKRMESSKPTPSQEENDLARLGAPPEKLADDGSGPEPKVVLVQRVVEPAEGKPASAGYQTRQATPKPAS
jgi:hypothetical protein